MQTLITILNLKYFFKKTRIGVLITMNILKFLNQNNVQFANNLHIVGIAVLAIQIKIIGIFVDKKIAINRCKFYLVK